MKTPKNTARDLGLLMLRTTVGGLMAGHGAQKLFGSFGGHGLEGTAGWLESLGLRPGKAWAVAAGASEFGSGLLTALGLLGPVGPMAFYGPMIMAWRKAHAGKPIWVTSGGAELPLVYLSAATTLALTGPGRFSLDRALGLKVHPAVVGLTAAGIAAGLAAATLRRSPQDQGVADEAAAQPVLAEADLGSSEELITDTGIGLTLGSDEPSANEGRADDPLADDEGLREREVGGEWS